MHGGEREREKERERERKERKVLDTILTSLTCLIVSMVYDATGGKAVAGVSCICKKRSERKIILCSASRNGKLRREEGGGGGTERRYSVPVL